MTNFNSKDFYTALVRASAIVQAEFGDKGWCVVWLGRYNTDGQPEISLEYKDYSGHVEEKVKGRDLIALVDELKRRLGFAASQRLALGAPTVEGVVEELVGAPEAVQAPEPPPPPPGFPDYRPGEPRPGELDDEIPF